MEHLLPLAHELILMLPPPPHHETASHVGPVSLEKLYFHVVHVLDFVLFYTSLLDVEFVFLLHLIDLSLRLRHKTVVLAGGFAQFFLEVLQFPLQLIHLLVPLSLQQAQSCSILYEIPGFALEDGSELEGLLLM